MTTQPEQVADTRPRVGALVTIPDRDGVWCISRGFNHPADLRMWSLVPVDATERDRADRAVLLRDTEFTPYVAAETDVLL